MHDILDAMWIYDRMKDESYMRRVMMPGEVLLTGLKRVVAKDSTINAICYGASLTVPGLLRFENNIEVNDEVIIITTKGEAVALGVAQMSTSTLCSCDYGCVTLIKRTIMEKDVYPRRWSLGPIIQQR